MATCFWIPIIPIQAVTTPAQHVEMLLECSYSLEGSLSADRDDFQANSDGSASARFGDFGCFAGYR